MVAAWQKRRDAGTVPAYKAVRRRLKDMTPTSRERSRRLKRMYRVRRMIVACLDEKPATALVLARQCGITTAIVQAHLDALAARNRATQQVINGRVVWQHVQPKTRQLLSPLERSAIAKQAAARRLHRMPAILRRDRQLLGLPASANRKAIRVAFETTRLRLRLPVNTLRSTIRAALAAERRAAARAETKMARTTAKARPNRVHRPHHGDQETHATV